MTLRKIAWLLCLLLAWFVANVFTLMALDGGVTWALGLLALFWGSLWLAARVGWSRLGHLAWAGSVAYGIGVVQWLDRIDTSQGLPRWLLAGTILLSLAAFSWVMPILVSWDGDRRRPKPAEPLPVEKPATPEQLRRWGPKD
ncbi:hypothetical protein [Variovorax boronicumulans]